MVGRRMLTLVRAVASWQVAHKGPSLQELAPNWKTHDRFMAPNYFNLGGGTSIAVMRSTELYALWVATVSGRKGAHVGRLLAVGTSWSFGGGLGGLGARTSPSR